MYSAGPCKREQNPEVAVPRLKPKFKRCENTNLEIEKISFSTFLLEKASLSQVMSQSVEKPKSVAEQNASCLVNRWLFQDRSRQFSAS